MRHTFLYLIIYLGLIPLPTYPNEGKRTEGEHSVGLSQSASGPSSVLSPRGDSGKPLVFRGESLATALAMLRDAQTKYDINFIANDLERMPVTASLRNLSVPEAVERLCLGLPVKVKTKGRQIFVQYDKNHRKRTINLTGSVLDAYLREDLIGAKVELLDEDSTLIDSTSARKRFFYYERNGAEQEYYAAQFTFTVPAQSRHFIFRISNDDYRTVCFHYVMDNVGRRETSRTLPPFYLHKKSKTLQEVTVTASRVRLYYKGDTIVYNADEFKLAEGSMLDALLKQLPGVELKSDGRIYHNGKFVDDLLLNGKDLFRGDRKQMLENLPAYTVKDVAIYDKQTEENEWLGRVDEGSQRYVIDVRLKKEYMVGWMTNAEAGRGLRQDERPYLARLFAMRTDELSHIRFFAKANNLNDEGVFDMMRGDGWKPGRSGMLRRNELARMDVNLTSSDKKRDYFVYVGVLHAKEWQDSRTMTQTFLPKGDTYDYAFGQKRDEDWDAMLWNRFIHKGMQMRIEAMAEASYRYFHHSSGSTAGLFLAPVEVSRQLLDDLYSPSSAHPNLRDTLINRQLRESKGEGHDLRTNARLLGTLKIMGSNDYMNFGIDGNYSENARRQFGRQQVSPDIFRHQYIDTPPRSKFELAPFVSYTLSLGEGYRSLVAGYRMNHNNQREQEIIYRLDRLAGADSSFSSPIDELPSVSEYQQALDRKNSKLSHYIDNSHSTWLYFKYGFRQAGWGRLYLDANLNATLSHQRNDYERGTIDTVLHRFTPTYEFSIKPWLRTKGSHHAGFEVKMRNQAPDLLNQAAIVDDTDPMNIRIGNPYLHYALRSEATLDGNLYSMDKRMHNRLDLNYGFTQNAIGMGQTYDRKTGRRTYSPTNVNGNWDAFARHTISHSFGDGRKHSSGMVTQFSYRNSVDLMGEDSDMPSAKSTVRTATISFEPHVSLSLGKHTLGFSSDIAWNRYSSDRSTFRNIDAWQYRIGTDAIVHLPWKFDLTTDLTLYGRTGYSDSQLNTADLVWNARLARPVVKGNLLLMVDGFDILAQLSNVTRVINAQGRTETYSNVLPRYVLFHAVWRFSRQPKKQ
ncbi:MAG: hypothetical protein K5945_05750 [Bacteroidaceae bacterium]|nr:hypothetical protein [Bacteroidaceae bacterium]